MAQLKGQIDCLEAAGTKKPLPGNSSSEKENRYVWGEKINFG